MKAIKRLSLSEQVVNSIMQYIQENDLKPGDQLPTESDFSESFQVSRTSIREAMKALGINGILTSTPGKGTFLLPKALTMSMGDDGILQMQAKASITEIMEVRTPLEVKAIELAAVRGTAEEIDALVEITLQYKKAVEGGMDWKPWGTKFHAQIAAMSGNALLISTLQTLGEMVARYRDNLAGAAIDASYYFESHIKICEAMKKRDSLSAQREMRKHMGITENALKGIVDQNNAVHFFPKK